MAKLFDGIKRNVLMLGVVSFFTDVSSEMIFPLLPLFLTTFLGAGKEAIGLIEGIADSVSSLADIIFGYVSDRLGKRKEFAVLGYGISSFSKIGIAFASTWPAMLVLRGAERIGKSVRTSPRDAIIAGSTSKKNRGKAFGIHRAMDTVGAIAGPAIAYLILSSMGSTFQAYKTVFYIAIVPAFLAVVLIALFVRQPEKKLDAKKQARPKFWESLKTFSTRYKNFLKISCLFSLAYFSFALLILRANDIGVGADKVLLLYLLYNIVYAAVSVPVGALSDRIGRKAVIAGSFALFALVCIGFVFASDLLQLAILFGLYGVFVATDESVNKAYISDITREKTRATALGAYNSAVGAVYLPGNLIFGFIWATAGAPLAFGAAALIAAIASAFMLASSGKK